MFGPAMGWRSTRDVDLACRHLRDGFSTRRLVFTVMMTLGCMVPLVLVEHLERFERLQFLGWVPTTYLGRVASIALVGTVVALASYALLGRAAGTSRDPDGRRALGTSAPSGRKACPEGHPLRTWKAMPALRWNRRCIAALTVVVLLCWLPYLVASFPCAMSSDAFDQLYQYQASAPTYYHFLGIYVPGEFVDHHPVVDTLVIGAFSDLGDALGSQAVGFFLLVLAQSSLTALFLSTSCCYLDRLGTPRGVSLALAAFCCVFPAFPRYGASIAKDMIFCVGWIPFVLCYLEAFRTRGSSLRRPGYLVALVATAGWCVVTKKLGAYIVVPSMLVMACALRGSRLRALGSLAATLLLFSVLMPALLYPAIGGVSPGGKQEALGFTIQQIVAVDLEDPDAIASDERAAIERVWDLDSAVAQYDPRITDPVKGNFRWESADSGAIRDYLLAWLAIGLRNPVSYIKTIVRETYGLYVPSTYMGWYETPNSSTDSDYDCGAYRRCARLSPRFHLDMHRPARLVGLSRELDGIWGKLRGCPMLSIFTTTGFYGGWVPFGCLVVTLYRRKRDVPALTPVALGMAYLLVCPTALTRYMYMVLVVLPLCIGWAHRSRGTLAKGEKDRRA